jgi:hypothetical protein
MSKYCVFCGNPLKESDKYCIICGKPVITNISRPLEKSVQKPKAIELESEPTEEEFEQEEIEEAKEEKKSKKDKKQKEIESVEKPLPFEVKEQMILYIEHNDIQLNKTILAEKLKEVQESLKDPKYDVDMDYKKSITVKLDAIKTLIAELKQKEAEIEQKMEKPFIVQKIQDDIEKKIFQLQNLTKEYKLRKVDEGSFEKLKAKYKQEKKDLEIEKKDLIEGMKLWIRELKLEKTELQTEVNLNKGRFSAKEISETEYNDKHKDFDIKLKKIDIKINTLEDLIK